MNISKVQYKNYGECLCMSNGRAELLVTLDLGPRVISYRLLDGENVFFNDVERKVHEYGEVFDTYFGKGEEWFLYGGHRLWTSPELWPETYLPQNSRIDYKETQNSVIFTPKTPDVVGQEHSMELGFLPDGRVRVMHRVQNVSHKPQTFAMWALSVMDAGGMEILLQPNRNAGLINNRVLSLWSYTDMNDERVYWGSECITLRQKADCNGAFKLGLNLEDGFACYLNKGAAFTKTFRHVPGGVYPDNGCSYETYTSNLFLEAESLGELKTVQPGQVSEHEEIWNLVPVETVPAPDDEPALLELVKKLKSI